jgi:hypothetical protein
VLPHEFGDFCGIVERSFWHKFEADHTSVGEPSADSFTTKVNSIAASKAL